MKQFLYLATLIVLLSSCKVSQYGIGKVKKTDASVELRTGEVIQSSKTKKTAVYADKIKISDTTIQPQDVAYYSDGKNTYANVTTGNVFTSQSFAKKINEGKIDLYTTASVSTGTGGIMTFDKSDGHSPDYMQVLPAKEFIPVSYKNLQSVITVNSQGYKEMLKYKQNKLAGNIVIAAGAFTMLTAIGQFGDHATTGAIVMVAGAAAIGTGICVKKFGRRHLYQAIDGYNKVKR